MKSKLKEQDAFDAMDKDSNTQPDMFDLSLSDKIVVALRRISQAIDLWSRELLHEFGLTSPQLGVLREIQRGSSNTATGLASALHLTQPTVTGILQRLEERGLIRRERSAMDKRSVVASITRKGSRLADLAPPLLRDRFQAQLAQLPEWRQTELLALLQLVAEMMQAPGGSDSPFLFLDGGKDD